MLGQRRFNAVSHGQKLVGAKGHGVRRYHSDSGKSTQEKSAMHKGLEVLLNRSDLKGIVDHSERSHALGADVTKKMMSLSQATGKDHGEILKMIGEHS